MFYVEVVGGQIHIHTEEKKSAITGGVEVASWRGIILPMMLFNMQKKNMQSGQEHWRARLKVREIKFRAWNKTVR